MKNSMNFITVLDFETGKVHMYKIGGLGWNPDHEACEAYLSGKGHRLKDIHWMVHEDDNIITN
jgi:hypothetical protein